MPRLLLRLLLLSALGLSEGRQLSRCELRDELLQRVQLPSRLRRNQERVLARVVCEVERFSSLNTNLVREYEKEVINLDDQTTTTATATTTATTNTTTVSTTTAAPAAATTTNTTTTITTAAPTTVPSTSPEQRSTNASTIPASTAVVTSTITTTAATTAPPAPSPSVSTRGSTPSPSVSTRGSTPSPSVSTRGSTPSTSVSTRGSTAEARRRRALRQRRASVSVVTVKFFGIFQFSDRKYCSSGYYESEDKCSSDCYVFADDDISNDVDCFVQSNKFWEVYRGASRSCKSRRNAASFFEACDAGESPPPSDRVIARVFLSGGSYK